MNGILDGTEFEICPEYYSSIEKIDISKKWKVARIPFRNDLAYTEDIHSRKSATSLNAPHRWITKINPMEGELECWTIAICNRCQRGGFVLYLT